MAVEQQLRGWTDQFATRTKSDVGEGLAAILALTTVTDLISFSGGFPDPATFPGAILGELMNDLLRARDATALQYAPTAGLPGPRAFMAERLERLEGVRPSDPELLITSGGIEALELLSKSFLDPGDLVMVEGPTYLGAIMAFRSFEADVQAVPMDAEGLRVDELAARLEAGARPKLLYTIPDHQNPAGVSMAGDRRAALVELAARYGFLLIEDVAYRELGFTAERLPSLWALRPDVVLQAGTFSKTFFPGVRLGWATGPPEVVAQMVLAKQNTDQCAGALGQRLLEDYGRAGHLETQNARARELYGRRCALLMAALEAHMPDGVEWTRPAGGFFSWLTLPEVVDTVDLARRAMEAKVAFVPGAPFYPDRQGRHQLRLAFSRVDDDVIDEGARRLGAAIRSAVGS